MAFKLLGQLVRRAWPLMLLGWAILLLASWLVAPRWADVAEDREFTFLPPDIPSRKAEEMKAKAFPEDQTSSNIVIILHGSSKEPAQRTRNLAYIEEVLEPGLRKIAEEEGGLASQIAPSDEPLFGEAAPAPGAPSQRSIISRIRTPNAPGTGPLLQSPDGRAMLVVLELTTDFVSSRNWPTVARIEEFVQALRQSEQIPPGFELTVTGSAVIGRDRDQAQLRSARATEFLTVALVVVLLIVIYRAPLPALIPLATVYIAVKISIYLLAILAQAGLITLFQGIQIYITILAYGAGVDYCLFLTARYKEELDRGASPADAIATAVGSVGSALLASAATVVCGIAMMAFARFGKFREAGFAIPFTLVIVLAATMTFSPALLRVAGRWAFWPGNVGRAAGASWVFRTDLLQRMWDRVSHGLLRRPGMIWLVTVALMMPFAAISGVLYDRISYDLIGDLPKDAPSVVGTRVLREHFPPGVMGPVTVLVVNPKVDFGSEQGRDLVRRVTDRLRERKDELGLADVRTLTAPLGITPTAETALAASDVDKEVRAEALRRVALERYTTALGERTRTGTRIDVMLVDSPFSPRSIASLEQIEQAIREILPENQRFDSQLYLSGTTANVRDLARVVESDRTRIEFLVLGAVFAVLILLLRGLVVPLYLLVSVLFSYYATLGVSFLVFWLLDPTGFSGIDWKVAIFLFTILVAVGADYNIFLLTRIHEEEKRHGPVGGVTEALTRTGPVISSCGIIMAGTFGSLLAGSLNEMKQLGFALAFGVLLDTFVVRPVLVPAFLIMLRSGRLSPGSWLGRFHTRRKPLSHT